MIGRRGVPDVTPWSTACRTVDITPKDPQRLAASPTVKASGLGLQNQSKQVVTWFFCGEDLTHQPLSEIAVQEMLLSVVTGTKNNNFLLQTI